MDPLHEIETTDLPELLGYELLEGGACEAVIVESDEKPASVGGEPRGRDGQDRMGRASASLFRIGEAYLMKAVDRAGNVRFLALRRNEATEYLRRVRQDGDWTVLALEDAAHTERTDRIGGAPSKWR